MRTHAPYSADFRAEAVRLALTSGQSRQAVARELGIAPDTLAVWVVRAGGQERPPGEALIPSEREELQRLRRENARLREEREILKKAAAFFAQESHSNR
jgi:transposase